MKQASLIRAIEAAGSASALGVRLGISQEAISQWWRVPVARVLEVERVTGIPRHELRPDIYPVEELRPIPTPPAEQFQPEGVE